MKNKPEIKQGVTVKRINNEHSSMKIGDTSKVVDRFGGGVYLEMDKQRGYEHDINNLEVV